MSNTSRLSRWHIVWYPLVGVLLANVAYQFVISWRQADLLRHARPSLVLVAVLNQLLVYWVVVPAMRSFYASARIRLSAWRAFGLVSAGLAVAKVIPAGDYLVWRSSLHTERGGVTATTQWLIMFYTWMFSGLVLLFLVAEAVALVFYRDVHAQTLVGALRFLPIGLGGVFLVALLATSFAPVQRFLMRLAFDKLGSKAVSPLHIIQDRKLGRAVLGRLTFTAVSTWLIEAFTYYLCMKAIGIQIPLAIAVFGFAFARLFTFLPIAPGGIGEIEAGTALFFAAYGYPVSPTITATLMYRLITYWPPLMVGAAAYLGIKNVGSIGKLALGYPLFAHELHARRAISLR
jgi:uncharacterized membrane protein YbhN (UPF0104 family)